MIAIKINTVANGFPRVFQEWSIHPKTGARDARGFRREGEKFGFSQFNPANKKSMRWTSPVCGIDLAARHRRGFRRFDADLGVNVGIYGKKYATHPAARYS
jgi:hypothetical protein